MKRFIVIGALAAAAALFGSPMGQVKDIQAAPAPICKLQMCRPLPSTQCMATTLRTNCLRQVTYVVGGGYTVTGCITRNCR